MLSSLSIFPGHVRPERKSIWGEVKTELQKGQERRRRKKNTTLSSYCKNNLYKIQWLVAQLHQHTCSQSTHSHVIFYLNCFFLLWPSLSASSSEFILTIREDIRSLQVSRYFAAEEWCGNASLLKHGCLGAHTFTSLLQNSHKTKLTWQNLLWKKNWY